MNRTQLLQRLRSLAAHSGTPEHERASALARIAELEAAEAAAARPRPPPPPRPVRPARVEARDRFRGMRARAKAAIPEKWPFGWTGARGPVEFEEASASDGGIVVGWKCPGCGQQLERRLSAATCAYVRRTASLEALAARVRALADGGINLLCPACWQRWNAT